MELRLALKARSYVQERVRDQRVPMLGSITCQGLTSTATSGMEPIIVELFVVTSWFLIDSKKGLQLGYWSLLYFFPLRKKERP